MKERTLTAMPPEMLPPEIWRMIILLLEDHCFAWFVLRRVSPLLRQVTEDCFASPIIGNCVLRFAGDYARGVTMEHKLKKFTNLPESVYKEATNQLSSLFDGKPLCFSFKAANFFPPDTKQTVVFKLQDDPSTYDDSFPSFVKWRGLMGSSHFVRFDGKLWSIKIPFITLEREKQEIHADWRLLCQKFYYHELKTRRINKPELRDFSRGEKSYPLELLDPRKDLNKIEGFQNGQKFRRDGWIFWDSPKDSARIFHLREASDYF
ncbi:hypothetical protein K469DRAFT_667557 [Zopfia rhizophila CBS 207.26]|uniref:F-box domain-containing protein n=1 Tax=Zopfia rhizophila CBS 207.26 TaxID=1314779 RepID=A0A6A6E103_9PEZI|nr:hypothetical protein K469DRAFT_667557 [Zopfia rhizophila CBS 207.26]